MRVLAVEGYRSLRRLVVPLGSLNVVTGANGSGKSSLYRALRLLADNARGGAVSALAREGGLVSTLWAGPEVIGKGVREGRHPLHGTVRTAPVALRLGFAGDEFGYAIDFGLPPPNTQTLFGQDPEIKTEAVWAGRVLRPSALLTQRHGQVVLVRDDTGGWQDAGRRLRSTDSMLSEIADPIVAPEVMSLREQVRAWRFYDGFRSDAHAPARAPRVGTATAVLDPEGGDLPAALQTLRELGLGDDVDQAVDQALPGSRVEVVDIGGLFHLHVHQPGMLRPLAAAELSDGTLRYLLWVAALLTPRPPTLFVLNEPETSLHPSLLPPLAGLIARAASRTQLITVTHSQRLLHALPDTDRQQLELHKEFGQTALIGQESLDEPRWEWQNR